MNCRKALAALAEGTTRSDRFLAQHLDDCPACREADVLATALDRAGETLRRSDISPGVIRETRRQAGEVLAGRERRASVRPPIRIPGPVLGWAASAALLVAAVVGVFRSQVETVVPLPAATPPPVETATVLDARIADLSTRVQRGMKDFEKRYGFEKRSIVETERERLRNRIKLSERILRDHLGDADGSGEVYRGGA